MAYRRPKSLRDILVNAKFNPDPSDDGPTGESKPCGNKRCFTCKLMTQTQIAKSSSGASVKLKRQTNCISENVIYLITCTQCGKQYVGETKRVLNERMNGHRSDWTKRRFQRGHLSPSIFTYKTMTLIAMSPFAAWNRMLSGRMILEKLVRATGSGA